MAWISRIPIILALFKLSVQHIDNNQVDDNSPFAEVAGSILNEKNMQNIGGMLNNFMQSESGKQIGDMLLGAGANNNIAGNQILEGIGSMLSQKSNGGGGLDPSLIGNVLSLLADKNGKSGSDLSGVDWGNALSMVGSILGGGNADHLSGLLPMILSSVGSILTPETEESHKEHSGHAWFLPPVVEQIHLFIDKFLESEIGRSIVNNIGAEKFVRTFADKEGKFDFNKFVELLENHSFRKHWIQLLTARLANVVSYFADPATQKRYLKTTQYFVNSIIKNQGFAKTALFDPGRPTETISALINQLFKRFFNTKVSSKQYVKPAVEYIKELFRLAEHRGYIGSGIDSRQLTNKLTDTINLEIIEPIARVYRAYRFAKKVPECDRYVICLINQEEPNDQLSLPGLKTLLSKSTSIFMTWFLSGHTGTSFWSLYHVIMEENNCQARFVDSCNDFHVEEIKVTTEYVHNEL